MLAYVHNEESPQQLCQGKMESMVLSVKIMDSASAGGSHAYNSCYSGSRDQEDQGSKPARANS
jgi:hypothetical protein